ncbi:adenylyl-sulfate kinase [Aneurinibacillus sp. REN35]|uniref:adenylyl-sulfate kinase n=1 Tax=Aneurinibacillus sp. REN35 TaxID=3237286 RepID=UPI0035282777
MAAHDANIIWHPTVITKGARRRLHGHKSAVLWFTGLSGSGKSTLANAVESRLYEMGLHTYLLDGDNIRHGINKDLGFSEAERKENIRRIGEVAKLFVDAGNIVLTAFISPYAADRELARSLVEDDEFIEIYVRCPLVECEKRDPKGLYKKARANEIPAFTGITAPYEEPAAPNIIIETDNQAIHDAVERIVCYLIEKEVIPE